MRRFVFLTTAASLTVALSAFALAAKPKPNETLTDQTHTYFIQLTTNSTGGKVQAFLGAGKSCGGSFSGSTRFVKIKRRGKFSASFSSSGETFTVSGRFTTRTKAKGRAEASAKGRSCGAEAFVAKP